MHAVFLWRNSKAASDGAVKKVTNTLRGSIFTTSRAQRARELQGGKDGKVSHGEATRRAVAGQRGPVTSRNVSWTSATCFPFCFVVCDDARAYFEVERTHSAAVTGSFDGTRKIKKTVVVGVCVIYMDGTKRLISGCKLRC